MDRFEERILSTYLIGNSLHHRQWSSAASGPHSFPCSVWDNVSSSGNKIMHMFAHGIFPKNWNLVSNKELDDKE